MLQQLTSKSITKLIKLFLFLINSSHHYKTGLASHFWQVILTRAFYLAPAIIQDVSLQEVLKNVNEFAEEYKADLPSPQNIYSELHCWVRRWQDTDKHDIPQDAASTLKAADASFFPNVHCIMRLLCTFAVSSAECKRSFSSLKRFKTYICEARWSKID